MAQNKPNGPTPRQREEMYAVFADRTKGFDETVQQALEIVTHSLNLDVGFVTRITDGTQYIMHTTESDTSIKQGAACPLDQAYCRETMQQSSPLVVQNSQISESVSDLAFETFGLGSYIGTKIFVDEEAFGTLCFAGTDPRSRPFSEAESVFVELAARLVSQALERRRYEQEIDARSSRLKAQKERFEDIAETTFDILYRIDLQARFTYVSSAAERILGHHPDELVGESFSDFIEESSLRPTLEAFQQVLRDEAVENLELEFRTAGNGHALLEINARPVFEGDEITGIQGVARDITHRAEQRQKLRIRNRAIEDSRLGITISELTKGRTSIIFANRAFEDLTGYTEKEILGGRHQMLLGEQSDSGVVSGFREDIAQGESSTATLVNYRKDGTPYWVRTTISPVHDDEGNITHVVQFHRDITEQERARRLIELFNRIHRHNLRNELNVIQGYSELLQGTQPDPESPDQSVAIDAIQRTATSLIRYTERVRELEQYANRDRQPTRIAPRAMISRIAESYRDSFPQSTVEYAVQTQRDVCAGDEIERAISELVKNSLVHNEPRTSVEITVSDRREEIMIEVADDGVGLSNQEVESINTGKETALTHGSGVGLWFVNWIVTRYGGSFQVQSGEENSTVGTLATVCIPAVAPESDVQTAVRPPTPLFL